MARKTEKKQKKVAHARDVLFAYYSGLRRYPGLVSLAIVGSISIQVAALIAPLYMRTIFNVLASGAPTAATIHTLVHSIIIIGIIWVLGWAAQRLQAASLMRLEAAVISDLFSSTFAYLIRHSHNFFISHFAGSLTHKVTKFARGFETIFDSLVMDFFPTAFFVVGAVGILFYRNHILGAMLGIWSVAFVVFQVYAAKMRQPLRIARSEADTQTTAALADTISNQNVIALFSGETYEGGLFAGVVDVWKKSTLRAWYSNDIIWGVTGIFTIGIEIALLYGATVFWSRGELTVGDFVLIQSYLLTTFDRLVAINRQLRGFNDAYSDASEMVAILDEPHGIADASDAQSTAISDGTIEFKDVGFHFHAERPILQHLSLSIRGGEKVALVGPSGAGKTTITKLLLRLYDVTSGAIEIDGQDIARVSQVSLRNAISFVPQEPVLFHRSLMENIRYGSRDATEGEVFDAARKAHCHEFIMALPDAYATLVGERGVKLSGGERQRIAIARAILKDSPILVLDEATSSLDSESEALIQDSLKHLMQGKTVVVIAHRLSTIMNVDRIIVIKGGSIIAQGSHQELLREDGLYQKLWSIQAGGFLQDE